MRCLKSLSKLSFLYFVNQNVLPILFLHPSNSKFESSQFILSSIPSNNHVPCALLLSKFIELRSIFVITSARQAGYSNSQQYFIHFML